MLYIFSYFFFFFILCRSYIPTLAEWRTDDVQINATGLAPPTRAYHSMCHLGVSRPDNITILIFGGVVSCLSVYLFLYLFIHFLRIFNNMIFF